MTAVAGTEDGAPDVPAVEALSGHADPPDVLFASAFPSLCRTAYLVVGEADLAEEIVMEAFARTLGRWDRVRDADQPLAYVRRVVVNLSVSRIRRIAAERRATRRAGSRRDMARWEADVAAERRSVLDAVRRLPSRQRACVVLRYFDDLPEQETAHALGCSVGTVKSQLAKARAHLATLLKGEED